MLTLCQSSVSNTRSSKSSSGGEQWGEIEGGGVAAGACSRSIASLHSRTFPHVRPVTPRMLRPPRQLCPRPHTRSPSHLSHPKLDAAAIAEVLGGAEHSALIDIHESGRYLLFGNDDYVETLN